MDILNMGTARSYDLSAFFPKQQQGELEVDVRAGRIFIYHIFVVDLEIKGYILVMIGYPFFIRFIQNTTDLIDVVQTIMSVT